MNNDEKINMLNSEKQTLKDKYHNYQESVKKFKQIEQLLNYVKTDLINIKLEMSKSFVVMGNIYCEEKLDNLEKDREKTVSNVYKVIDDIKKEQQKIKYRIAQIDNEILGVKC